ERTNEYPDENFYLVDYRGSALVADAGVEVRGESDQHCRQADEAVQDGDELRHVRHFDARRQYCSDDTAHRQRGDEQAIGLNLVSEHRSGDRDQHADDAEEVASSCGFLSTEAVQAR